MNGSGIYMIINRINGKFYLGGTISFERRFKEHQHSLNKGKHHSIYLQRAWNKYGKDAFIFKPIFVCERENINLYEQQYLDQLQPYKEEIGYNMNYKADSRYGRKMSIEARQKLSRALKGRPSPRKGMKATEETKRKLSESHRGHKSSKRQKEITSEMMKGNQYRKGCIPWNKGVKVGDPWNKGKVGIYSEETIEKMSVSAKNRIPNRKGEKHSKKAKKKMSIAIKRYWKMKKQKTDASS